MKKKLEASVICLLRYGYVISKIGTAYFIFFFGSFSWAAIQNRKHVHVTFIGDRPNKHCVHCVTKIKIVITLNTK